MAKNKENGMIMFAEARRGYRKEDVHRYLEEQNLRFEEKLARAERRGEQQNSAVIEIRMAELRARLASAEDETTSLRAQISDLREKLDSREAELEAAKSARTETIPTRDNDELSAKRLGELFIRTEYERESAISAARAEAERILTDAHREADELRINARVEAKIMLDKLRHGITEMSDDYIRRLTECAAEAAKKPE